MIVPVNETGTHCDPEDYRLISYTPVFSRTMERLVKDSVIAYLLEHKLLILNNMAFVIGNPALPGTLTT